MRSSAEIVVQQANIVRSSYLINEGGKGNFPIISFRPLPSFTSDLQRRVRVPSSVPKCAENHLIKIHQVSAIRAARERGICGLLCYLRTPPPSFHVCWLLLFSIFYVFSFSFLTQQKVDAKKWMKKNLATCAMMVRLMRRSGRKCGSGF